MAKSTSSIAKMQGEDIMESTSSPEFQKFFIDKLKDIYWAEKHLTKALPKMQKAATSPDLKKAFGDHLEATKTHVSRLEQVFELMGSKAQAKKCDAMAGLVEEGKGIIEETEKGTSIRDVGLVLAAQKVEHYEIATYGGLAQLAKTIGNEEVKALLGKTLDEEKEADKLLTTLAEGGINGAAAKEGMNTENAASSFDSINLNKNSGIRRR